MGSFFSHIFGSGHSKPKVTAHDQAMLDLKNQRDRLKQYQKKINIVIEREREIARQLLKEGKKDKALLAIQKKKYQETLVQKTSTQLDNIEKLIDQIENAQIEKQVFDSLKLGTQSLQEIQKEMNIEAIEKLMGETQDAMAYQDEVSRILSQNLSTQDHEDVSQELAKLESDMMQDSLSQMKPVPSHPLPQVAKVQQPQQQEKQEEDVEEEEPAHVGKVAVAV